MANYIIPENPKSTTEIRKLEKSDPANAEAVFNPLVQMLINNTHFVKSVAESAVQNIKIAGMVQENQNGLVDITQRATALLPGLMDSSDKEKLDGVAARATRDSVSTTTPKSLGTASAGTETSFARGDHVHPKPSASDSAARREK